MRKKRYVIITLWGYPGGGGESYMLQTMKWTIDKLHMDAYWISFTDFTNKPYDKFEYSNGMIHVSGGFNTQVLSAWLKLIKPDIVHHQGHKRIEIAKVCTELNIRMMTGYHYWYGAIDLYNGSNRDILKNVNKHKKSPDLDIILSNKLITPYVCSEFVADVVQNVTGIRIPNIIYPSSSSELKCNYGNGKYVTMINLHQLKGGGLFKYLMDNLKNIPLLGIKSEPDQGDLFSNKSENNLCKIIEHTDNMKSIYSQTRILLVPSLVDETFCRVVNEAQMNGIPIITTGRGNIRYMVNEDSAIILSDPIDDTSYKIWTTNIIKLYSNKKQLNRMSKLSIQKYNKYSEDKAFKMFKSVINKTLIDKIMFFVPWCDQGLGIQARNYVKALQKYQQHIHIFSYSPYVIPNGTAKDHQYDPGEWIGPHIYYSKNTRENVTDEEVIEFVLVNRITKCVIPETCWHRVFEITCLLKKYNVRMYAIPNIEIVRKDELNKHYYFDRILCNNKLCMDVLSEYGFNNMSYLGYVIEPLVNKRRSGYRQQQNCVKFLLIGGMNAFTRKNVLKVCQSFVKTYDKCKCNIHLTITIQKYVESKIYEYASHPGINMILKHLSYKDIMNLYSECDVTIQVSKHEGLGLCFYEALSAGAPVLTLDAAPYNEIIKDGVNGWLTKCYKVPMTDNPNGIVMSNAFDIDDLANRMHDIVNDNNNLKKILNNCKLLANDRREYDAFCIRLQQALELTC